MKFLVVLLLLGNLSWCAGHEHFLSTYLLWCMSLQSIYTLFYQYQPVITIKSSRRGEYMTRGCVMYKRHVSPACYLFSCRPTADFVLKRLVSCITTCLDMSYNHTLLGFVTILVSLWCNLWFFICMVAALPSLTPKWWSQLCTKGISTFHF